MTASSKNTVIARPHVTEMDSKHSYTTIRTPFPNTERQRKRLFSSPEPRIQSILATGSRCTILECLLKSLGR